MKVKEVLEMWDKSDKNMFNVTSEDGKKSYHFERCNISKDKASETIIPEVWKKGYEEEYDRLMDMEVITTIDTSSTIVVK